MLTATPMTPDVRSAFPSANVWSWCRSAATDCRAHRSPRRRATPCYGLAMSMKPRCTTRAIATKMSCRPWTSWRRSPATASSRNASPTTPPCSTPHAVIFANIRYWWRRCRSTCAAGTSITTICFRETGRHTWIGYWRSRRRRSDRRRTALRSLRTSSLIFDDGDERPDLRDVHLLDRYRTQVRLIEEPRQIQVRGKSNVHRHRRDRGLDLRHDRVGALEVVQDDDATAGTADPIHLFGDGHRIRHHADHVRCVDHDVAVVGEGHLGRVHLHHVAVQEALFLDALLRLVEHAAGQIDPGDPRRARIHAEIDAGADTDFEHVRARSDAHLLNRFDAAGMERRTIRVVVHFGDVLINLLDEVGPDVRH